MVKNNLSELLEKRGKSVYWLQKQTGIAYPSLLKIKKNETNSITYSVLEAICITLECTPNEFLEIVDDNNSNIKK